MHATRHHQRRYTGDVPTLLLLQMLAKLLSSLPSLGHLGSDSGLLGFAAAAAEWDGRPPQNMATDAAAAAAAGGSGGIEPTFRVS